MIKGDFHIHTITSDSALNGKQVIDVAAKRGFDVLAFTEHPYERLAWGRNYKLHDVSKGYRRWKKYAKSKGILLLPGCENLIEGKEVVLVNFEKDPWKWNTFDKLDTLRDENVVTIAPHPFFGKPSCLKEKLEEQIDRLDGIEHCHFYTKQINYNKPAMEIAKKYGKPMIANSDAHSVMQLENTNYTLLDCDKNVDSVLEAIRKGKVKIVTKPLSLTKFAAITLWSFKSAFETVFFKV